MFNGVNKVFILGVLGADPDLRYMPNGKSVSSMSVATKYSVKDKNSGQFNYKTEWHKIVLYDRLSDAVSVYLKKGSKVYLEGSLRTNKWEDKDGIIRYSTEIIANNIQILDSKSDSSYDNKRDMSNFRVKDNYKNVDVFSENVSF